MSDHAASHLKIFSSVHTFSFISYIHTFSIGTRVRYTHGLDGRQSWTEQAFSWSAIVHRLCLFHFAAKTVVVTDAVVSRSQCYVTFLMKTRRSTQQIYLYVYISKAARKRHGRSFAFIIWPQRQKQTSQSEFTLLTYEYICHINAGYTLAFWQCWLRYMPARTGAYKRFSFCMHPALYTFMWILLMTIVHWNCHVS